MRIFLNSIAAGALFAGMALAPSAWAQTAWDMPTPYGDGVFHTQNVMMFADEIREATGGSLDITVHSAGSLFGHAEIKDSVRRGLAPAGEVLMSRLANEDPVFGVDSIPFLAASYEDAERLWSVSRPLIEAKLDEQGLVLLYAVPWPGQSFYVQEEVAAVEQMAGKTFRAYNAATERLAQLMGAVPTQVETGDIPTAFATGRVSAMITSPSTGVSSQAWDFVSHFVDTQAWLPKNMVIANKAALEALTDEQRMAIEAAASAAEQRGWEMSMSETSEKIAVLEENGMAVSQPSDAFRAELVAIGEAMTAEWLANAGDDGQKIIDGYMNQ